MTLERSYNIIRRVMEESQYVDSYASSPDFIMAEVRKQVLRLASNLDVASWHAIQYRISEVGTPLDRQEPRWIQPSFLLRPPPVLPQSSNNDRPWDPINGLFVSPKLGEEALREAVGHTLRTLKEIKEFLPSANVFQLSETVREAMSPTSDESRLVDSRPVALSKGVAVDSAEILLDLSSLAGAPVLASVTNDLEWLYPDDPRIWNHLKRCQNVGAYAVFIARKLSVATFPVLKRLSAVGVQLHHLYVSDNDHQRVESVIRQLYWPPSKIISSASTHKAFTSLQAQLRGATRSFVLQLAYEAVDAAFAQSLHDPELSSPRRLLQWADMAGLEMPDKWVAAMAQWSTWDELGALHRPYLPQPWFTSGD